VLMSAANHPTLQVRKSPPQERGLRKLRAR
jgi:hypothetical protein